MSNFKLRIRDFRVLDRLDWQPEGVCILSGANGTGKSTTLAALRLLRTLFLEGEEAAVKSLEGKQIRRLGLERGASTELSVEAGDIVWNVAFPAYFGQHPWTVGEELRRKDKVVLLANPDGDGGWLLDSEPQSHRVSSAQHSCAKVYWDRSERLWMRPLVDALDGIHVYDTYQLHELKSIGPTTAEGLFLHDNGSNLWSVLSNWKKSPGRFDNQFDWVLQEIRKAFPGVISDIGFVDNTPCLNRHNIAGPAAGLLRQCAADGSLAGLLHLTAVAGARPGSLLAFDEIENHMHPHAIRSIIQAMRERAEERDLTIILTTHSPVVLNQFRHHPEQVYVLAHGDPDLDIPAPMTDLHDEDWLALAKLGSLYERLVFAAPDIGHNDAADIDGADT